MSARRDKLKRQFAAGVRAAAGQKTVVRSGFARPEQTEAVLAALQTGGAIGRAQSLSNDAGLFLFMTGWSATGGPDVVG